MTRSELESIIKKSPIFQNGPFAHNATGGIDPPLNSVEQEFNYIDGFPEYFALPIIPNQDGTGLDESSGGRVLIKDINMIGNLGTRGMYVRQQGGLYQYDKRVSDLILGYPQGAILDYWDSTNNLLRKVICIKEGGNCTYAPNDAKYGINGSVEHYWEICDTVNNVVKDSAGGAIGGVNLTITKINVSNNKSTWNSWKNRIIADGVCKRPFLFSWGRVKRCNSFDNYNPKDSYEPGYVDVPDFVCLGCISAGTRIELTVDDSTSPIVISKAVINGKSFSTTNTSLKTNIIVFAYKDKDGNVY